MKEIKKLEDIISLEPSELFKDQDVAIMAKLSKKYENKCWANAFIVKVVRILLKGPTEISKNRTDGSADINLQFEVECETFPAKSMIVCKIEGINEDKLMCKFNENTIVTCLGRKTLISPKAGQYIPVIVDRAEYITSRSKVSIRAQPFMVERNINVTLYPAEEFTDVAIEILRNILANSVKLVDKSNVKFILDALYPYSEDPKKLLRHYISNDFSVMSLTEIANQIVSGKLKGVAAGCVISHPVLPMQDATVFKLESKTVPKGSNVFKKEGNLTITKSPETTFSEMLATRLLLTNNMIVMMNAMSEIYKTEVLINSHKNIWESYNKLKI